MLNVDVAAISWSNNEEECHEILCLSHFVILGMILSSLEIFMDIFCSLMNFLVDLKRKK